MGISYGRAMANPISSIHAGTRYLANTIALEDLTLGERSGKNETGIWWHLHLPSGYPLVIKHGLLENPLNGGFNGKTIHKWWIFHCHVWLPEGYVKIVGYVKMVVKTRFFTLNNELFGIFLWVYSFPYKRCWCSWVSIVMWARLPRG